MKVWFDYKTVIVSGASSGIGKGLVKKLICDHGCTVIGIARNEEKMLAFVEELGNKARYFSYSLFDVSKLENWENFAADLTEKGIKPDIIINNAGILPKFDKFLNYSIEDLEYAMNINFNSCVYSMKTMMPLILKSRSAGVVNIASSAALCSLAGTSVYSASKAALKSLTESVREEYVGQCYIGLVCPGFTKTDIFRNQHGDSNTKSQQLMDMISTDCDKMVEKIITGMLKKKSNMVFGIDAKAMNYGRKFTGRATPFISSKVMKKSNIEMFDDVFKK